MDYFLLKQSGNISIPRTKDNKHDEPSIRIMQDISQLDRFDYLAAESLVSDRMKLLLEQYLLDSEWQPCAFVEPSKKLQKIFWFLPPLSYFPEQVTTAPNGTVCSIHVKKEDFCKNPRYFPHPQSKRNAICYCPPLRRREHPAARAVRAGTDAPFRLTPPQSAANTDYFCFLDYLSSFWESFAAKSFIASDIFNCCGQTASQLLHAMQADGCFSSGTAFNAIGAIKPPPVKLCSL